ncbi:Fc receptor-like protein 2, partial [Channa argus]|uniref:Fc receptor-like protein 2 n=1 Tax=Channa argus TaxID=215402 RepID=UPI003521159F
SDSSQPQNINNNQPWAGIISVSEGGFYFCRGGRGDPLIFTSNSSELRIGETAASASLTNWNQIFSGESITFTCNVQGGGGTEWTYEWTPAKLNTPPTHNEHVIDRATESDSGNYRCRGKKYFSFTEWSNVLTLTILDPRVSVTLQPNWNQIFSGESITLKCEIQGGGDTELQYEWKQNSQHTSGTLRKYIIRAIESHSGNYRCRGRRNSLLTQWSDPITLTVSSTKPQAELRPDNREVPVGGRVTLTCSVKTSSGWTYYWYRGYKSSDPLTTQDAVSYSSGRISVSQEGLYCCRGGNPVYYTENSQSVRVDTIFREIIYTNIFASDKHRPVLTVSPSWLSPGASVTLNCEVEHPSAGWRFYWYKTVPDLSAKYYRYELLPATDNGTEQNSSIIHGQTHTAGYVCRAGRGDPVYYTDHSEPKFVWSGDVHPSASLTVNPDRVQHFTSDSVSLSCEGNSTEWTVRRFTDGGFLSHCYHWGTMTGSTCNISTSQSGTAVYWCESGSGEFSNSVNITIHNTDIILLSPVHPATEGESVTVGCKLRNTKFVSSVFFYQNDKLRQNDTRQELNISAVSESDEGFYKCQYSGKVSPQSWLSVKGELET